MARTVSRAGENGESTPLNVPSFDGEIVEHKADPVDLSAAKVFVPPSTKGLQDITPDAWIENLMSSPTNFSSPKGLSFKLKPNGIHGSIQQLDESLRRDPFVLRAVQRGKIKFLSEEEAYERINELEDEKNETGSHLDHLMESLGVDASSNNGMYKPGVPEEGEPNGPSQTPQQIWAQSQNKPESPKNFRAHVGQGETEFIL